MGKLGAFKDIPRETPSYRPIEERVQDYNEVYTDFGVERLQAQASRCMHCGVPFCNNACPLGNLPPEWNDMVFKGRWEEALALLLKTNNFPEITGRVCPALCEESCVLNINGAPVSIKLIELNIIEEAFKRGLIKPEPPAERTGKKVAVVGSGPAGLACAMQLNRAGHQVTVFERAEKIGGMLAYGIPNYKLDKRVLERRIALMKEEGIEFLTRANVGFNTPCVELRKDYNAVVLCGGATKGRNLEVPGRELKGVHFAMEYLGQQNELLYGKTVSPADRISAEGKNVVILGGGDTGADCLGTALRQHCKSVRQFELLPEPPSKRTASMPWPVWPMILRTSSAHEESEELQRHLLGKGPVNIRDFSINTKSFSGENGAVEKLHAVRLEWQKDEKGRFNMKEIPGSEFEIECDLCLLALGFVHPEHDGPVEQFGLEKDSRGNVKVDEHLMTKIPGVFSAGDMRRGQSLVVWAISEGRQVAREVDSYLMGKSELPAVKVL